MIEVVDKLYKEKYGVDEDVINNHKPKIIFDVPNTFFK
jgi:hypothetical protein